MVTSGSKWEPILVFFNLEDEPVMSYRLFRIPRGDRQTWDKLNLFEFPAKLLGVPPCLLHRFTAWTLDSYWSIVLAPIKFFCCDKSLLEGCWEMYKFLHGTWNLVTQSLYRTKMLICCLLLKLRHENTTICHLQQKERVRGEKLREREAGSVLFVLAGMWNRLSKLVGFLKLIHSSASMFCIGVNITYSLCFVSSKFNSLS
jgi:hypothetical protein